VIGAAAAGRMSDVDDTLAPPSLPAGPIPLPDPFDNDVSPWLLRRLDLAIGLATQLQADAARIVQTMAAESPTPQASAA